MENAIKFTWEQFNKAVKLLADNLKPVSKFAKNIYGLPRGGLILAVALSHQLDLPLLFDKKKINKETIIVDDISDSGQTLTKLLKGKEYLRTVTLITKSKSIFQPSYTYLIDDT